ncbi:hypothetical protein H4R20_006978, partial [Coemansia guatemalensis]
MAPNVPMALRSGNSLQRNSTYTADELEDNVQASTSTAPAEPRPATPTAQDESDLSSVTSASSGCTTAALTDLNRRVGASEATCADLGVRFNEFALEQARQGQVCDQIMAILMGKVPSNSAMFGETATAAPAQCTTQPLSADDSSMAGQTEPAPPSRSAVHNTRTVSIAPQSLIAAASPTLPAGEEECAPHAENQFRTPGPTRLRPQPSTSWDSERAFAAATAELERQTQGRRQNQRSPGFISPPDPFISTSPTGDPPTLPAVATPLTIQTRAYLRPPPTEPGQRAQRLPDKLPHLEVGGDSYDYMMSIATTVQSHGLNLDDWGAQA